MKNWLFQKNKINLFSFVSSPWLLAILPTLVIILLLPSLFQPYQLTLKQTQNNHKNKRLTFFEDLDHNGIKEKIDILDYREKFACCFIWANNSSLKRQFNFYGKIPQQENLTLPVFCDVNQDGVKEVFVFSQNEDSLFINAVDLLQQKVILNGRFISKIGLQKGLKDFVLRPITNHDYNHDSIPEIYFLLNGCYSLYPRKIMAYDYKNDTIISSVNTGSQHFVTPIKTNNNKLLFISTTPATNNCPIDFSYSYIDTCAWLFGFNDHLDMIFEPIPFNGVGCSVVGPMVVENKFHYSIFNTEDGRKNYIITTDSLGTIENKKTIPSTVHKGKLVEIKHKRKTHYLLRGNENNLFNIFEYNPEKLIYEQTSFTQMLPNATLIPFKLYPKQTAYLADNYQTNQSSIFLNNLNQELSFHTKLYINTYNLYAQSNQVPQGKILMLTNRKELFTYLITKNKYYPLRFLLFIIIYLLNAAFVFLSIQLYKNQANKQHKLQKEIVSLQLKLVNAQLDPHFAFNALNLVSSKILKGNRYEAYDLMTSFSSMMRSAMSFSDIVSWNLTKELEFVRAYLKLMSGRFKNLFEYKINNDENIDLTKIFISRLLIQNTVENSIKHAFNNISYTGLISINITQTANAIKIVVSDNGIGRKKARHNNNTTNNTQKGGNGLRWCKKQVNMYNELYSTKISFIIEDLSSNHKQSGTQTTISIPKKT